MKYLEKTRLGLLYGANRVFPPGGMDAGTGIGSAGGDVAGARA